MTARPAASGAAETAATILAVRPPASAGPAVAVAATDPSMPVAAAIATPATGAADPQAISSLTSTAPPTSAAQGTGAAAVAPACEPALYDDFIDSDSWTNRRLTPSDCARVPTTAPAFSWTQPANRDKRVPWTLQLRESGSGQLVLRAETGVPRLALHKALPQGDYSWVVTYSSTQGKPLSSSPRRFSVSAESAHVVFPTGADFAARAAGHPHPRLLPSGSSFAAIAAAAARSPFHAGALNALLREADAALAAPVPTPDSSVYDGSTESYQDKVDKTALREVVETERHYIEATGLAAWFTGDARYRAHGVQRLLELAAWSPTGPTSVAEFDQANRVISLALGQGLTLFWHDLSEAQKLHIASTLKARVAQAMDRFEGLDRKPYDSHVTGDTWAMLETLMYATGSPGFPEASAWLDRTWEVVQTTAETWGRAEGGFGNGVAYGWYRMLDVARVAAAVRVVTGVDLARDPWVEHFGDFLIAMTAPGGAHSSAFGDSAQVTTHYRSYAGNQFRLYAALTGKPRHAWYATAVPAATGARYVEPWHLMLLGAGIREAAPRAPDSSVWRFADAGIVAFHSDTSSPERSSLYFRSSEFGSFNHSQADQNAFTFVSRGRDLLISGGYYPYYMSPHDAAVNRATRYKNALTFDGGTGQAEDAVARLPQHSRDARGSLLRVLRSSDWAVATGDATLAYRRFDPATKTWSPLLGNAVRSVTYNAAAGVAVIYDWADSADGSTPHAWELNFTAPAPIGASGRSATVANDGASACIDIHGPAGSFTTSTGFDIPPENGAPDQHHARFTVGKASPELVAITVLREDCRDVPLKVSFAGTGATVALDGGPAISFDRRQARMREPTQEWAGTGAAAQTPKSSRPSAPGATTAAVAVALAMATGLQAQTGGSEISTGAKAPEVQAVQRAEPNPGAGMVSAPNTAVPDPLRQVLTDFEGPEFLQPSSDGQSELLRGIRAPAPPSSDYRTDPGSLTIQYEGGNSTMRAARLSAGPDRADNRVLGFELRAPNVVDPKTGVAIKGRVQMNAYDTKALRARELYYSTRLYLGSDFDLLRQFPKTFNWLTISEWWNNAGWLNDPHPFRITVSIVKPSPASPAPLRFRAHASVKVAGTDAWNQVVWDVTNEDVAVPVGRWATLEYFFREGNAGSGQFYMALTPDGGTRQVVFHVDNWTHHPDDPSPDGLTHLNPLKLYTSAEVIDHVRARGGKLGMSWDDLSFTICQEQSSRSTSACARRFGLE